MKKQQRFDPKYLCAQTPPTADPKGVKANNGGIAQRSNPAPIVVYRANMEAVSESSQPKRTLSAENSTLSNCRAGP